MQTDILCHAHRIGALYRRRQWNTVDELRDTALRFAQSLDAIAFEKNGTLDWDTARGDTTLSLLLPELAAMPYPQRPDELRNVSLYNGTAGIVHGLLRLWALSGEESLRQTAQRGMETLKRLWRSALTYRHIAAPEANYGYYFGIGGVGAVLLEGVRLLRDDECAEALRQIVHTLEVDAKKGAWTERTGLMADAGCTLLLTEIALQIGWDDAGTLAVSAGEALLRSRVETPYGITYERIPSGGDSYPNFVYGCAGTGYAFARLHALSGDVRFLDAARDCAKYLMHIAQPAGSGKLIPYIANSASPIYYLNTCHGPAGSARLFYELYRQTADERMAQFIRDLECGLRAKGATERMSDTLWNNVSYCCGTAGILHAWTGGRSNAGKALRRNIAR